MPNSGAKRLNYKNYNTARGPDSSVGIATDYGLDGTGIEYYQGNKKIPVGRGFSHTSRPVLGPT
jgi:hypothetical protein